MEEKKNSHMPEDTNFKQQRLPAWQPLLTPNWVIGSFAVIGVVFIVIGIILLTASGSVVEVETQYDNCGSSTCVVNVAITDEMKAPVYFYYKLENFYQNHRRYVKSRSDKQLRGEAVTTSDLSNCSPLDVVNGKQLYPCGLIANSFFNDTFSACLSASQGATCNPLTGDNWNGKGIAWASDVSDKFKDATFNNATMTRQAPSGVTLPSVTNEEFIVWMRTAGLPTFKKLHRKINTDLPKGSVVTLNVTNVFNVASFGGKKSVVFSTASWLGGKNSFLGIAYLIVGSLALLAAIAFFAKHQASPRQLGDLGYFKNEQFGSAAPASPDIERKQ